MISVAMCTFNGEKYIKEQIESIINQSLIPDEIVICDDCSKDNTVNIIKETLDNWSGKVHLVVNEKNLGYRKNFEKAISLCNGDIIFLSDQDDVWNRNKIEIMVNALNNSDAILAFHDVEVVDENLKLITGSFWKLLKFNYQKFLHDDFRRIFASNVVQGSACALKKELVNYAKPFPEAAIHDEWLALVAVAKGNIIPINKSLAKYRQSGNNAIGAGSVSLLEKITKLITNLHSQNIKLVNELIRRQKVLSCFHKRFGRETLTICRGYKKYLDFNTLRLNYIQNKDLLNLICLNYFQIYDTRIYALRRMLRDIIACIF